MTVGELVSAMQMAREVEEARLKTASGEVKVDDGKPAAEPAAAAAEENVTSLPSARLTK
jgi:hypothetical protein